MRGQNVLRMPLRGHRAAPARSLAGAARLQACGGLRALAWMCATLGAAACCGTALAADGAGVEVSGAWVTAQADAGADVALSMTILNRAAQADALLRVRCPVATLTEQRVVDKGEGPPTPREVRALPVAAGGPTVLGTDTAYVMLLQTAEALPQGSSFGCTMTFRNAGAVAVTVQVRPS